MGALYNIYCLHALRILWSRPFRRLLQQAVVESSAGHCHARPAHGRALISPKVECLVGYLQE